MCSQLDLSLDVFPFHIKLKTEPRYDNLLVRFTVEGVCVHIELYVLYLFVRCLKKDSFLTYNLG